MGRLVVAIAACLSGLCLSQPGFAGGRSAADALKAAYAAQRGQTEATTRSGTRAVPLGANGEMVVAITPGKADGTGQIVRVFTRDKDTLGQVAMGKVMPRGRRGAITPRVEHGLPISSPISSLKGSPLDPNALRALLGLPSDPPLRIADVPARLAKARRLRKSTKAAISLGGRPVLVAMKGEALARTRETLHKPAKPDWASVARGGVGRTFHLGPRTTLLVTQRGTPVLYREGTGYSPGKQWMLSQRR